jgi:putative ATP-binding cassette transporter
MNQNAEYSAVNDAVRGQFFRKVWAMITPYWRSEEKGKAWTLLIAVIVLSLFSVAISVWINSWYKDFYNALQKKDEAAFWQLILSLACLAHRKAFRPLARAQELLPIGAGRLHR